MSSPMSRSVKPSSPGRGTAAPVTPRGGSRPSAVASASSSSPPQRRSVTSAQVPPALASIAAPSGGPPTPRGRSQSQTAQPTGADSNSRNPVAQRSPGRSPSSSMIRQGSNTSSHTNSPRINRANSPSAEVAAQLLRLQGQIVAQAEQLTKQAADHKTAMGDLNAKLAESRDAYNRMLGKQLLQQRQKTADDRERAEAERKVSHFNIAVSREEDAAAASATSSAPTSGPNLVSSQSVAFTMSPSAIFGGPNIFQGGASSLNLLQAANSSGGTNNNAIAAAREAMTIRRLQRDVEQKSAALEKSNDRITELEIEKITVKSELEMTKKELALAIREKGETQHQNERLRADFILKSGGQELKILELQSGMVSHESLRTTLEQQLKAAQHELRVASSKLRQQADTEGRQGTTHDQLLAETLARTQADDRVERQRRSLAEASETLQQLRDETLHLRAEVDKFRAATIKAGIIIQSKPIPATDMSKVYAKGLVAPPSHLSQQLKDLVMMNGSLRLNASALLTVPAGGSGLDSTLTRSRSNSVNTNNGGSPTLNGIKNNSIASLGATQTMGNTVVSAPDPLAAYQVLLADPTKNYSCIETGAVKHLFAVEKEAYLTLLLEGFASFEKLFNTYRAMLGSTATVVERATAQMHLEGGVFGGSPTSANGPEIMSPGPTYTRQHVAVAKDQIAAAYTGSIQNKAGRPPSPNVGSSRPRTPVRASSVSTPIAAQQQVITIPTIKTRSRSPARGIVLTPRGGPNAHTPEYSLTHAKTTGPQDDAPLSHHRQRGGSESAPASPTGTATSTYPTGPIFVGSWYNTCGPEAVRAWLSLVNVFSPALENTLHNAGFTDMIALSQISEGDLVRLSVTPGVRRKLLAAVEELQRKMQLINHQNEEVLRKTYNVSDKLMQSDGEAYRESEGWGSFADGLVFEVPTSPETPAVDCSLGSPNKYTADGHRSLSQQARQHKARQQLASKLLLGNATGKGDLFALLSEIHDWFSDFKVSIEAQDDSVERILEKTRLQN